MQGCKEAGIPAFGTLWDFVSLDFFFLGLGTLMLTMAIIPSQ